jgi:hypothetical protein
MLSAETRSFDRLLDEHERQVRIRIPRIEPGTRGAQRNVRRIKVFSPTTRPILAGGGRRAARGQQVRSSQGHGASVVGADLKAIVC